MKITSIIRITSAVTASLCLLSTPATAKPDKGKGEAAQVDKEKGKGKAKQESAEIDKGKGADKGKGKPEHAKGPEARDIVKFDKGEHDLIRSLFGTESNRSSLPPGLAMNLKRGKPLPPGWQKKLVPGYRLEDAWMGSFVPVSYDDLPKIRRVPNTQLYYHDNKVVRVMSATREILDVIDVR